MLSHFWTKEDPCPGEIAKNLSYPEVHHQLFAKWVLNTAAAPSQSLAGLSSDTEI
jgi:hypothetical protein